MVRLGTDGNSEELKIVLDRLAEVYSSCRTYEDQGVVRESMPNENGQERVTEDFFTTAFDREAKRFRYQFRTGNPQKFGGRDCIVWRNGDSVKMWTGLTARIETDERIGLAVAGAVGTCGEPAFLIPNLLASTEVEGRGLLDMDDLRLAGKLNFNDTDYLKITGYYPSRSRVSFWVDVNTSLLLRVEEETAMTLQVRPGFHGVIMGSGPLVSKTAITYSPHINISIPESAFEMRVPEK